MYLKVELCLLQQGFPERRFQYSIEGHTGRPQEILWALPSETAPGWVQEPSEMPGRGLLQDKYPTCFHIPPALISQNARPRFWKVTPQISSLVWVLLYLTGPELTPSSCPEQELKRPITHSTWFPTPPPRRSPRHCLLSHSVLLPNSWLHAQQV